MKDREVGILFFLETMLGKEKALIHYLLYYQRLLQSIDPRVEKE